MQKTLSLESTKFFTMATGNLGPPSTKAKPDLTTLDSTGKVGPNELPVYGHCHPRKSTW